jgi:hypothetical protein
MSDRQPIGEALALEAILYLTDALPPPEHADFEVRLADDQKARDALTLAVAFVESCEGQEPVRPDPSYRRHVIRRALPRSRWWRGLWSRREYPGHPLVWGSLGACLVGLMLLVGRGPGNHAPPPLVEGSQPKFNSAFVEPEHPEAAQIWAAIPRGEHLLKSHEEGVRRKNREQLHQRLTKKM